MLNISEKWLCSIINHLYALESSLPLKLLVPDIKWKLKIGPDYTLTKIKKKITLPRSTLIRTVQYFDGQLVLEFIGTAAISYKINIDLIYCKASHPFILRIQNTMSFSFTTSIIFKYFRSHAFCILPNSSFMIVWVVRHFCLFVHRQRNASRAK